MQGPKPAAGYHSTTSPTKSSPSSFPPRQRSQTPAVNPNPLTQNTVVTGGGAVELTCESGPSAVVAIAVGSSVVKGSATVSPIRKIELREIPRGLPRCPECALEFPSWKSVFGHLRKHPDRKYRDYVGAGEGIDVNLEPMEVKKEVNKETQGVVESSWEANKPALKNEIMKEASESSSSSSSANKKKPLAFAFDLNELPPEEEEE